MASTWLAKANDSGACCKIPVVHKHGDGPPDGQNVEEWAFWKTDTDPPTAECAAQPVTATS